MAESSRTEALSGGALTREQSAWRWRILISTYLAYMGYYFCRKVFGLVKTSLHDQFDWEMNSIAHIWTAFLIAYVVGQFINGFIGRKWGPRVLLLGGLGISILCNIVFATTNSYYAFLTFMAFNGLVQASGWPGVVGAVSHWVRPHERGTIMGAWGTSYITGNLLVKVIGSFLLGVGLLALPGWRWSFMGCTSIGFVMWWIVYAWQRNKPEDAGLRPLVDVNADEVGRAIQSANVEHFTLADYLRLATNPLILAMGLSYFGAKFLRYALDSWLPTILTYQGLDPTTAGLYSSLFDVGGILPCVLAGLVLDKVFKGNWAKMCFFSAVGVVIGYVLVLRFQNNPLYVALSFGFVGFMLYGADTLLNGAGAIAVAGERNGVAIAGLVNCIGSVGSVVQEELIGMVMTGDDKAANIGRVNLLGFWISVGFAVMMLVTMWRVGVAHAQNKELRAKG